MAFSINTNIASLQAQDYLRINQDFQQRTINRVTSGLRIVSSGDDAAGLAIANSFRSDRAVLAQGVRNANDALSTLQTIDGGLNNISQLLDRARTLAAQSATGTFSGDRNILDAEFQSVISEIDRQAQVIGLNTNGSFAKNLSVFLGGGRGATDAARIANGSVAVNLSTATVDASSLKLRGFRAEGASAADVDEIVSNTTNTQSLAVAGKTDFFFRGAGFGDDDRIRVSVNLGGVENAEQLVAAINNAITDAGNAGTTAATAFKNAGVKAKLVTDANNKTSLVFESSTGAFQVAAGDRLANALLGNHTNNVGADIKYTVTGAAAAANGTVAFGTTQSNNIIVRVQGGSLASAVDLTLDVTTSTATTVSDALSSLSSLVANNSQLQAAGITVSQATGGAAVKFVSSRGENFEVLAVNDEANRLGLGNAVSGSSTAFDVTSITAAGALATSSGSRNLYVSVGGGAYHTLTVTNTTATASEVANELNSLINANAALQRAGVRVDYSGSNLVLSSSNGSFLRVAGDATLGYSEHAGVTTTTGMHAAESFTTSATKIAGGASASTLLTYAAIRDGGDDQVITIQAKDATGVQQSLAITLKADSSGKQGATIDEALNHINNQLQAHASADMRRIVAVKERDGGLEKIRFISALSDFKVSVGSNAGVQGITTSQGAVVDSAKLDGGANVDISTQANAEAAVTALAQAVSLLGNVQAVVGRGQNQFNFAVGLAQTQLNNLAASESRIRDADLAAEAANMTRAQILQQAGIAALAQANAAPQAVLSLLRG
jgi:flagellin